MLTIRLQRLGKRNDPFYRVVVLDKTRKRGAAALATIGTWYPDKNSLDIDKKVLADWQDKGAQISNAVRDLLDKTKK